MQTILDLELVVADVLNFQFTIHHPYLAIHGILLDAQVSILFTANCLDLRDRNGLFILMWFDVSSVELTFYSSRSFLVLHQLWLLPILHLFLVQLLPTLFIYSHHSTQCFSPSNQHYDIFHLHFYIFLALAIIILAMYDVPRVIDLVMVVMVLSYEFGVGIYYRCRAVGEVV